MDRRAFLSLGVGTVGMVCARAAQAQSGPPRKPASERAPDDIPYGQSRLGLSNDERDGILFVPKAYRDGTPSPLLIMLHGFGGWADEMKSTYALAEEFGVVLVVPESRDATWGRSAAGFDADVRYIGAAYRQVRSMFSLDPDRVGLGGRSDGAGYALSMGLAYGDIFNHLLIFAGGLMGPLRRQGSPKVFFGHGVNDRQMPIDVTARKFAASLRSDGYDVTLREHEGGHGTPLEVVREGFAWFVGKK